MLKEELELPLIDPVYSTHHNGFFSAILSENPSIRNWYLNNALILACNRKFLKGFTSPQINVLDLHLDDNPHLEKHQISMRFLKEYTVEVICNFLDCGYYVHYSGVDDYYVEGKSFYKERHMNHDGGICGYNKKDKTFCMYAYDKNWIYRKFWTSQKSFEEGMYARIEKNKYGYICGLKPKKQIIKFSPCGALNKIAEYLDSSYEKYPEDEEGRVFGIVVHDYIAKYISKLFDGSIPYECMDRRVMRLIWEHKKVMLERIEHIEKDLELDNKISTNYKPLLAEANNARMLYASHNINRRDSLLPIIQHKLIYIKSEENKLLNELLEKIC